MRTMAAGHRSSIQLHLIVNRAVEGLHQADQFAVEIAETVGIVGLGQEELREPRHRHRAAGVTTADVAERGLRIAVDHSDVDDAGIEFCVPSRREATVDGTIGRAGFTIRGGAGRIAGIVLDRRRCRGVGGLRILIGVHTVAAHGRVAGGAARWRRAGMIDAPVMCAVPVAVPLQAGAAVTNTGPLFVKREWRGEPDK